MKKRTKNGIKLYNIGIFTFLMVFIMTMFTTIGKLFHRPVVPEPPETSVTTVYEPEETQPTELAGPTDSAAATTVENTTETTTVTVTEPAVITSFNYNDVPAFDGENAYYIVNNNIPFFTPSEITVSVFENYSDFDSLGRCGVAYANVCKELMPTDAREEIGSVKPSGWMFNGKSNNNKYDFVDGKYIYNRCHLIGFQLAGENANEKNLITGTRYLNVTGMLPFENMVADYVKATDNHVLYRITPVFINNELLCRGILMEAYSVEDKGNGIEFCVWCYNVQPGVIIDYATGVNYEETDVTETTSSASEITGYVVNDNSMKFHLVSCKYASTVSANQRYVSENRDNLIREGYVPCKVCNP